MVIRTTAAASMAAILRKRIHIITEIQEDPAIVPDMAATINHYPQRQKEVALVAAEGNGFYRISDTVSLPYLRLECI